MTNGAMNVEIGNPAYKIYEGDPDDDAGELLDSDFALDPDKVKLALMSRTTIRNLPIKLKCLIIMSSFIDLKKKKNSQIYGEVSSCRTLQSTVI